MSSWRDKVKTARLPEDTVRLVLRGDLAVEHERLVDEIEKARERGSTSLAGKGTATLEERLREIEAESADSMVVLGLRALPKAKRPGDDRPTWRELTGQHPPRVTDGMMEPRDRLAGGMNADTFPEPMVRACIVAIDGDDPELDDAAWAELMAAITAGQFDELVNSAWNLNQGRVDIPFWSGGSKPTGTSGSE